MYPIFSSNPFNNYEPEIPFLNKEANKGFYLAQEWIDKQVIILNDLISANQHPRQFKFEVHQKRVAETSKKIKKKVSKKILRPSTVEKPRLRRCYKIDPDRKCYECGANRQETPQFRIVSNKLFCNACGLRRRKLLRAELKGENSSDVMV